MKMTRLLLYLSVLLLFAGCRKKEFSISFEVEQSINANYKLIYYASDKKGGFIRESAVAINAGKGDFKGPTINPVLVYLYTGPKAYPLMIYAERGEDIKVTGNDATPARWMVEGNDINKDWSQWRNKNAEAIISADPAKINKAVAEYVVANRENPLSALLLLTTYSRIDDETGFRRLWRDLQGKAADPVWASLAGRADQPARSVATPGRVVSVAFRSMQNGVDTLRPDSVKGTLLFFWNNSSSERKAQTDSIKALAKEFSDSSARIIADVCLDPDSVTWRSSIRTDSLKKVARLWAPAGLADSRVMLLGVPRTPFFIVLSPDGHQRFRGSDLDSAFSSFRSLLDKK
ncbi:MAG: DUF4369 domain-containing protein [Muribaculaceae bacterium]|nr:DUF4369 domain-containing protein [Muribaculaceae bacterium]